MKSSSENQHLWRFVTNHAHVLETIASEPTSRLRDIAAAVGITERTARRVAEVTAGRRAGEVKSRAAHVRIDGEKREVGRRLHRAAPAAEEREDDQEHGEQASHHADDTPLAGLSSPDAPSRVQSKGTPWTH